MPPDMREEALARLGDEKAARLRWDWEFWSRPSQLPPPGDWDIWLVLAGRGFGKTRAGAEWVRAEVDAKRASRIAIVADTAADARDVLVEGASGLLSIYPPAQKPLYEPSKRRVTFHTGATATLYSAEDPEQLRGPQHDLALADELAKWRYMQETFDQIMFGLRLGSKPRLMITTTPRPVPLIRELLAKPNVVVTRGGTRENRANLAASFWQAVHDRYAGTRLGRQELDGEVVDDVPGALWTRRVLDGCRVREDALPDFKRVVVAVDPAVTSGEEADETGIVCAALGEDGRAYVLEDASLVATPQGWASRAISTLDLRGGDALVVEVNQGGEMVAQTIRSVRPTARILEVRATRGKHVRAEPISALYEQGRVSHVGAFPDLEDQMVLMTAQGYLGDRSPDRLDALVWALTALFPNLIRPVASPPPVNAPRAPAGQHEWMNR
ncbi:ATP-binding protein [Amaricoccus solimangrovi]|uniref:ATP-binding protein n=2 Tax=Amaricoccus solimangrovi TaxID=2589815 RepID=A0A501X0K5_9RHOB|nr:ATP-binding protein [Amaricoccus solimangrovi]